jgi:dephospho-CoA kinase
VSGARRASPGDRLWVVGVTGGAASGKSTFVEILAALGPARVIDADREGHAVLRDPAVARALAREFGDDVLGEGGEVQRSVLGPRAFANPEALARLNAIVHPPLLARIAERLESLANEGFEGLAVIDAALLVEWDRGAWCDRVVAVLAPPEEQVARLVRERGTPEPVARDVVSRQLPNAAREAYADVTLWNDGPRERFDADARALAGALWAEARTALSRRLPPAPRMR